VAGNLLVIIGSGAIPADYISCSGFTASLQSGIDNSGSSPDSNITILYRIADASDVAASNYTIAQAGAGSLGVAAMLRISGWATGDPVNSTNVYSALQNSATPSMGNSALSIARAVPQLLLMISVCVSGDSPFTSATASAYTITSSDSNPSWTEVVDSFVNLYSGTSRLSMAVAYATSVNTSNITAWSATLAADTSGNADAYQGVLAVILQPTNATGTNALHSATPIVFNNAGVDVGTTGTNTLLAVSPTMFDQLGRGETVVWTEQIKPPATWVSETK